MHNFVHLNLSISLFVAYVIFAIGIEVATSNEVSIITLRLIHVWFNIAMCIYLQAACKIVAALIQYFLLSAFCWMMCEGIMLYLMLVVVFSRLKEKWWLFLMLGWGRSLFCVSKLLPHTHIHTHAHIVLPEAIKTLLYLEINVTSNSKSGFLAAVTQPDMHSHADTMYIMDMYCHLYASTIITLTIDP